MNTEEKYLKELYDEKELVMKFPRSRSDIWTKSSSIMDRPEMMA